MTTGARKHSSKYIVTVTTPRFGLILQLIRTVQICTNSLPLPAWTENERDPDSRHERAIMTSQPEQQQHRNHERLEIVVAVDLLAVDGFDFPENLHSDHSVNEEEQHDEQGHVGQGLIKYADEKF